MKNKPSEQNMLTIAQVAAFLKISATGVKNLVDTQMLVEPTFLNGVRYWTLESVKQCDLKRRLTMPKSKKSRIKCDTGFIGPSSKGCASDINDNHEPLYSIADVSEKLGIPVPCLHQRIKVGSFPEPCFQAKARGQRTRRFLWRRSVVNAYIAKAAKEKSVIESITNLALDVNLKVSKRGKKMIVSV